MRSVGRYAPALGLMAVIFFLSAQSQLPRVASDLDIVLRKLAHMTEFGLLWALWLWAQRGPRPRAALRALAVALLYAVSDEVHQSFVADRNPSAWDVAIDAAGVGVAAGLWTLRARHGRRRRGAD